MNASPITELGIKSVLQSIGVRVLFSTNNPSDLLSYLERNTVNSVICDVPFSLREQRNLVLDFFNELSVAASNIIIMTSSFDKNVIMSIVAEFDYPVISTFEEVFVIKMQLSKALKGEETLSPYILSVLNSVVPDVSDFLGCLTNREREILFYLLNGNSVSEISKIFARSIKTISAHKINIMKKLNVENEIQLFAKVGGA